MKRTINAINEVLETSSVKIYSTRNGNTEIEMQYPNLQKRLIIMKIQVTNVNEHIYT